MVSDAGLTTVCQFRVRWLPSFLDMLHPSTVRQLRQDSFQPDRIIIELANLNLQRKRKLVYHCILAHFLRYPKPVCKL